MALYGKLLSLKTINLLQYCNRGKKVHPTSWLIHVLFMWLSVSYRTSRSCRYFLHNKSGSTQYCCGSALFCPLWFSMFVHKCHIELGASLVNFFLSFLPSLSPSLRCGFVISGFNSSGLECWPWPYESFQWDCDQASVKHFHYCLHSSTYTR